MTFARTVVFVAVAALAGCESNKAANLLCAFCNDDSQCGGNPCFQDVSGQQFCGAPCDACPAGFSCQPLEGTDGTVEMTCFPDNESCLGTPGPNQSGTVDLGASSGPPPTSPAYPTPSAASPSAARSARPAAPSTASSSASPATRAPINAAAPTRRPSSTTSSR